MTDSHSSHTVLQPFRMPKRRVDGVAVEDAVQAYDADGSPLGYFQTDGREIRPVYAPGQTVKIDDPALAESLIAAGVIMPPGVEMPSFDTYDAENALSEA